MERAALVQLTSDVYQLTLLFPKGDPLRHKLRDVGTDFLEAVIHAETAGEEQWFAWAVHHCEVLLGFLHVASEQRWVKQAELQDIVQRYEVWRDMLRQTEGLLAAEEEQLMPAEPFIEEMVEDVSPQSIEPEPLPAVRTDVVAAQPDIVVPDPEPEPVVQSEESRSTPSVALDKPLEENGELDDRQERVLQALREARETKIGQLVKLFPEVSRRTLLRDLEKLQQLGFATKRGKGRGAFYLFRVPLQQ